MRILICFAILVSAYITAYSIEYTESHLKNAEELIEITEMQNVDLNVLADEVFLYLEIDKNDSEYDKLKQIYISEFKSDYLKQIRDLYVSYYNESEIKELIRFYKTPLGQKLLQNSEQLNQDIMLTAELWTQKIFSKLKGQGTDEN